MTHELAKQLKDAGFPQVSISGGLSMQGQWFEATGSEKVYMPTLSELIEACGDCGFALHQVWNGWRAYSGYADDDYTNDGKGSTPEEAVAMLWLALNKKNAANS